MPEIPEPVQYATVSEEVLAMALSAIRLSLPEQSYEETAAALWEALQEFI